MKDKIIEMCEFCKENEAEVDVYDEQDQNVRICEKCDLDLEWKQQEPKMDLGLNFEEKLALVEKYFGDKVMLKAIQDTFPKQELELWIDNNIETIINKAENKNVLAGGF